jgi:hypothetical protein
MATTTTPTTTPTPTPTMDTFLRMATGYNYLAVGAEPVYDISDEQIEYDYNNWSTSEQDALADTCANSYSELLSNQAYGQELFSSPTGQESISEALGVGSCSTYQSGDASDSWFHGDDTSGVSQSTGCSAVSIQAGMSLIMQSQLSCTITNIYNQMVTNAEQSQLIDIQISDSTFYGEVKFDLSQSSKSNFKFLNFTDSSIKTQLSTTLETNINQLQAAVQESLVENSQSFDQNDLISSYEGPNAPMQGQKAFQACCNAICNSAAGIIITDIVNDTITNICKVQNNTLNISNSTFYDDVNIVVDQTMVTDIVSESIVQNVVEQIMNQAGLATITTSQSVEQTKKDITKNSFFTTFILLVSVGVSIFGLIGPFKLGKKKKANGGDSNGAADAAAPTQSADILGAANTDTNTCFKIFGLCAFGPLICFVLTLILWLTAGGTFYFISWLFAIIAFAGVIAEYMYVQPSYPTSFPCSGSDNTDKLLSALGGQEVKQGGQINQKHFVQGKQPVKEKPEKPDGQGENPGKKKVDPFKTHTTQINQKYFDQVKQGGQKNSKLLDSKPSI